jgi:hypothetical protein
VAYSLIICDKHKHTFNLLIELLRSKGLTDAKFYSVEERLISNVLNGIKTKGLGKDGAGNRKVTTWYFREIVIITIFKNTETMKLSFPP